MTAPGRSQHLALIGGRGCGKTSTAACLAALHSALRLLDLDAMTLEAGGVNSVTQIVNQGGWRAWRDLEYDVLERALQGPPPALVDCGGGIVVDLDAEDREVLSERKVALLRNHCRVVYLRCDPDLLWSRIAGDPGRPALSADESFQALMARREPWYQAAADRVIEADAASPEELAQQIGAWFLGESGAPAGED